MNQISTLIHSSVATFTGATIVTSRSQAKMARQGTSFFVKVDLALCETYWIVANWRRGYWHQNVPKNINPKQICCVAIFLNFGKIEIMVMQCWLLKPDKVGHPKFHFCEWPTLLQKGCWKKLFHNILGNQFYHENLYHIWPGLLCDLNKCWMKLTGLS